MLPAGRRLHAKAFAFETSHATFWLTGSPNATVAAMIGRNTEAALWFSTKEFIDALIKDESLTIQPLDPANSRQGQGRNQTITYPAAPTLALGSATLQANSTLDLRFNVPANIRDFRLRITNFNEVAALPVAPTRHTG